MWHVLWQHHLHLYFIFFAEGPGKNEKHSQWGRVFDCHCLVQPGLLCFFFLLGWDDLGVCSSLNWSLLCKHCNLLSLICIYLFCLIVICFSKQMFLCWFLFNYNACFHQCERNRVVEQVWTSIVYINHIMQPERCLDCGRYYSLSKAFLKTDDLFFYRFFSATGNAAAPTGSWRETCQQ